MNNLFNLKQAGAYLGISARSVRRLIDRKLLNYYKIGGLIKISKNNLEEFLKNSKINVTNLNGEQNEVI